MDGTLHFPAATPPAPGETVMIAPGLRWLRMRLPFALNHINLWLIEDGPAWAIVDCGYGLDETKQSADRCGGSSSPITTRTISGWRAG